MLIAAALEGLGPVGSNPPPCSTLDAAGSMEVPAGDRSSSSSSAPSSLARLPLPLPLCRSLPPLRLLSASVPPPDPSRSPSPRSATRRRPRETDADEDEDAIKEDEGPRAAGRRNLYPTAAYSSAIPASRRRRGDMSSESAALDALGLLLVPGICICICNCICMGMEPAYL